MPEKCVADESALCSRASDSAGLCSCRVSAVSSFSGHCRQLSRCGKQYIQALKNSSKKDMKVLKK